MNVCKIVGVFLWLLVMGVLIGSVPMALTDGRRKEKRCGSLARALLIGTGVSMLCFALVVLTACRRAGSFVSVYRIYVAIMAVLFAGSLCLQLFTKRGRLFWRRRLTRMAQRQWRSSFCVIAFLYMSIVVICLWHRPILSELYDLPERTRTMQETGQLSGIDPLTGEATDASFSWKSGLRSILPAWYLFFIRLFGMRLWDMLFKAVPLWMTALCMSAYYEIGTVIFGGELETETTETGREAGETKAAYKETKRLLPYLLFFTLYVLCGNGAYMNPPHALLHAAYEETALINNVLIPCIFAVVLRLFGALGNARRQTAAA